MEAGPNARWSLEFVSDQFAHGRRFRILNFVDDVTKECLRAIADTSISGRRVARELTTIVASMQQTGFDRLEQRHRVHLQRCWPGARITPSTGTSSRPASRSRTPLSRASCIDGPAGARDFDSVLEIGRVRSCIRPVIATDNMAAGPDGDRGSRPHQRVALVALKLFGLSRSPAPPIPSCCHLPSHQLG